jgi:hypothetical protein
LRKPDASEVATMTRPHSPLYFAALMATLLTIMLAPRVRKSPVTVVLTVIVLTVAVAVTVAIVQR